MILVVSIDAGSHFLYELQEIDDPHAWNDDFDKISHDVDETTPHIIGQGHLGGA